MGTAIHFGYMDLSSALQATKPATILDIGVGAGHYGLLCREALDIFWGRIFPDQWQVQIDGIEVFAPLIERCGWQKCIYNRIIIGDVADCLKPEKKLPDYDCIIAGDVIEHMDKETGTAVLKELFQRARKMLFLSIPIGSGWLGGFSPGGNEHERHLAEWEETEVRDCLPDEFALAKRSQMTMSRRGREPGVRYVCSYVFVRAERGSRICQPNRKLVLPASACSGRE